MGLFTSLIFNNGTAHTFVFRGQLPDSKSVVGEYIEPAAASTSQVKLDVKHDETSKTVFRSLLQYKVYIAGADSILAPITVNFTVVYSKKHAAADVILAQKLLAAAVADASFHTGFSQRLI